ncbi:general odorant-binding protein 71 [Episyrphus balteatus]|uniref:general odorant-binding protein 71 n=1 Tax=Episyrphus balteatus TaxID=286459 RepID=UPI00248500C2|nr:general odorant-binding protein 71 [Episyrphus balteatus]
MIAFRSGAFLILLIVCSCILVSLGIKCRTDEGPSDEDLKRITRSCMRKISENGGRYNQNQSDSSYGTYDNWDYDEYNRDDRFRQGNRERLQMRGRSKRSGNDRKYDLTNRERNGNQNSRTSGNTNSNNNYNNHHGNSMGGNSNNHTSYGDRRSRDMQNDQDRACVVHCFFEELNVLNNDDYPDKHKFTYILTKDIRDRELRGFYTDTIQECFHYVETQRRKDKCQFSREIINCMTEYAKSNCEDWQDHTLIFT